MATTVNVNRNPRVEKYQQIGSIAYGNGRSAKMASSIGRLNLRAWLNWVKEEGCEVVIRGDTLDIYRVGFAPSSPTHPERAIAKRVREQQLIEELQKM